MLLRSIPALLYMAGIFAASSVPDLGELPAMSDKSWHALAYSGLGALVAFALAEGRPLRLSWGRALVAVAIATVYGATDEWHQSFVPGRAADAADLLADAIGAAAGVTAAALAGAARAWGILGIRPSRVDPS